MWRSRACWAFVFTRGLFTQWALHQRLSRCAAAVEEGCQYPVGWFKWSKWNSNSGLGWIKVKKGDSCVHHNMMEYYPVRSENNFEMQFDDERPPIYNAEDYAHHLRKYSRLTGAQLYSLSRHRSENRADKKENRTGWEWKICNIEHDYWLIGSFVGYFRQSSSQHVYLSFSQDRRSARRRNDDGSRPATGGRLFWDGTSAVQHGGRLLRVTTSTFSISKNVQVISDFRWINDFKYLYFHNHCVMVECVKF